MYADEILKKHTKLFPIVEQTLKNYTILCVDHSISNLIKSVNKKAFLGFACFTYRDLIHDK